MARDSYTRYPRPILWLVPGGEITLEGSGGDGDSRFGVSVEPFYISKFPITNEQFTAFDEDFERSACSAGDSDPATGVSFEMALAYCEWYAGVSRKPMRLPNEVEWEYACRSDSSGKELVGDEPEAVDAHLWHRGNSSERVPKLDDKKANGFGLFGMLGGVWEWTSPPYRAATVDGAASRSVVPVGNRVAKGGSFRVAADHICCAIRRVETPGSRCDDVGFRIVKSFRR